MTFKIGPGYASLIRVVILLSILIIVCKAQREWSPWRPPWENFDKHVVVRTYYGDVRGVSVPWHVDDEFWNQDWDDKPRWWIRRINCFLGIPYAEPPLGWLRFQKARRPRWGGLWDATYFRPACPQKLDEIQKDIPDFRRSNISEDCLYLNIFAPNLTTHSKDTLYPVVVFFHGGDWVSGTPQQYPGHVLAQKMVVVVSVSYRLGALGFLTTEDEHAPGNWGLLDQNLALEFVKENIKKFRGDPDRITLMGEGTAGAGSVGMHLISPLSRGRKLYHQAIMMSGSDLSPFAYIRPFWRPREYAAQLAYKLGCPNDDTYLLIKCLRNNRTYTWQAIVDAQHRIAPNDGPLGIVWGPVQDGGFYQIKHEIFLPETPHDMRRQELFDKVPVLLGLNAQDGCQWANETIMGLGTGLHSQTFKKFWEKQLLNWKLRDIYRERAYDALEFQYTHWPDPENFTARSQMYIDLITDYAYGTGLDDIIKLHSPHESSYMYVFEYKSWDDYLPHWMGTSYSAAIPYVFGVPFMNETVLNETYLQAKQWYDYEERNISDFMMLMWTNFIKDGVPTPNVTRNITWEPFNDYNLTYLIIDEYSNVWFRYRQAKYGFWRDYWPSIALMDYFYPTATPTPAGQEYKRSTGGLAAVMVLLLGIVGVCVYLLVLQSRKEEDEENYRDMGEVPLSFSRATSQSGLSTASRKSPYVTPDTSKSSIDMYPKATKPQQAYNSPYDTSVDSMDPYPKAEKPQSAYSNPYGGARRYPPRAAKQSHSSDYRSRYHNQSEV